MAASVKTLTVSLLGVPRVQSRAGALAFRTRKTLALMCYLAVERGPHPRERLADLLWPDAGADAARASVRVALLYLRQALGDEASAFLDASRDSIGLRADAPLDVDVHLLEEARRWVRQAQGDARLRPRVQAAVDLYRGAFLSDLTLPDAPEFEFWVERNRVFWQGVQEHLLEYLGTEQIRDHEVGAALDTFERWTRLNPGEELAWQRLIEAHMADGDLAEARRAWTAYRQSLVDVGAAPSPLMSAIADHIRNLRRSADTPVSVHPAQRHTLIGRRVTAGAT